MDTPKPAHSHYTVRMLLDYLKRSQMDYETLLDLPLVVGISDGMRNFDHGTIVRDWPRIDMPRADIDDAYPGRIRIDCHTSNKRLVEMTKKQRGES